MARPIRKTLPKEALMYFEAQRILCEIPLKYVTDGNKDEGEWVTVYLPQEKENGYQRAKIIRISGMFKFSSIFLPCILHLTQKRNKVEV